MSLSIILSAALLGAALYRLFFKRSGIEYVPGPTSPSWLYGNMTQLLLPHTYGDYEFKWQDKYGGLYRIKGPLGEDRLVVSDPAALKHILNDTATFQRSAQQQYSVDMLIGKHSVFYVTGEDHRRIRNVMNTAFSPAVIRALPPTFKKIAEKIANRWEEMLDKGEQIGKSGALDIYPSLHDATLDAVGEGAMGYEFKSLENSDSELGASHRNIIALSGVRSKYHILVDALVPYIPPFLLTLALRLPTAAFKTLQHNRVLAGQVSSDLIRSQEEVVKMGGEAKKDLTYALVKANASSKSGQKMSVEEMEQQIPSLMIAGQDTTGNTLSWALYRLAYDQELQKKIRAEVMEAYEQSYGDISYATIESLPWLNAFLKETLRLHPGLPMSDRVAHADSVIPLSEPIVMPNSKRIWEVPVKKGQHIIIATASYNRLKSVWGPDAHEFKPQRWLSEDLQPISASHAYAATKEDGGKISSSFGPYANLSTFFGGPRVCIGWRFAVTELQVLFTEIVRRFKFSLPPPTSENDDLQVRMSVAVNMIPVVGENGKPSLPIIVENI